MSASIDVVIPSYRLTPATLLPILQLQHPPDTLVRFYVVADNPAVQPDARLLELVNGQTVSLLINERNLGTSATRNRGIEAGTGDWILFLDDDIDVPANLLDTYASAIAHHKDEIGFIGVVKMPPPPTPFARAVAANGSMGIFTVAEQKPSFAWGASANFMVKRAAVGDVRFSDAYPRFGGGEEVEFFLRVREQNNYRNYMSLPAATVVHPWWGGGKQDLTRFYRYGKGNSWLAARNPAYKWYDFLNMSETLMVTLLVLIGTIGQPVHAAVAYFAAATILIEYVTTIFRVQRTEKKVDFGLAWEVILLRNVYEAGILFGNLGRGRLQGIGERFNYEGGTKNHSFRTNRFKIIKLLLYAVAVYLIWQFAYAS